MFVTRLGLIGLAFCALLVALAASLGTTQALADGLTNTGPKQASPSPDQRHLRFTVFPDRTFDLAQVLAAPKAIPQLPLWSKSVSALGGNFTYAMVGQDPFLATSGQTTINVWIIPVRINFRTQHVVFDPSAPNPCAGGRKPIDLVRGSPLFTNTTFKIGTTDVGGGPSQFANAFQRANYFKFLANKSGYKIVLTPKAGLSISQPADNFPDPTNESCGKLGYLDINIWDTFAQQYIVSHKAQLLPNTLPLFVFSNVVMYDTDIVNCCIGGYHGTFHNSAAGNSFQTYATTAFLSNNAFDVAGRDAAIVSHEVIEWLADPSGDNPTPAWGHLGQVSGCQNNLETGDPLSGKAFLKPMPNGFSYHIQDEAFTSWFYRQTPSTAIGGRYSFAANFTHHAGPVCQ